MPSLTVENYIKQIYQLCAAMDGKPAATGQIASSLGVSPGTVTSMLKTLSESQLVTYIPYEGVQLTDAGRALALRILRRHRLIELFLVTTLGLSWDEVHEEAENMEHAVSDQLVDRIDDYLDHPRVDPHGDPIPGADGSLDSPAVQNLAHCVAGEKFRIARVIDQSSNFLQYLSKSGMTIGTEGHVVVNHSQAGVVTVGVGERNMTLAHEVAAKLLVTGIE